MKGLLRRRPTAETVVREHAPMVQRHLRRLFGPGADIDDALQTVFVEVIRSLPTFEYRSSLATWIRRITWNVAYQEMRLHYRRPRTVPLDEADRSHVRVNPSVAEQQAAEREAMHRLYAAIESLDAKQRIAVVLHDIEGRTLREISETLGKPVQTVASQLHAGRARLVKRLRETPPPLKHRARSKLRIAEGKTEPEPTEGKDGETP